MPYRAKAITYNATLGNNANSGILYTIPSNTTARITFFRISGPSSSVAYIKINSTSIDTAGFLTGSSTDWGSGSPAGSLNSVDWGLYLNSSDYVSVTNIGVSGVVSLYMCIIEEY